MIMQNFCLSDSLAKRFKMAEDELGYPEHIVNLDCNTIDFWALRERQNVDLGDIDALAASIRRDNQFLPIIVVQTSKVFKPYSNASAEYVVLSGCRRWLACKKLQIDVQAIVKNLRLDEAIRLTLAENKHEQISDYARGMFYHSLLLTKKITLEELSKQLKLSETVLNDYLAFAQIPSSIWNAIGDPVNVSAKTAVMILDISSKGPKHLNALLSLANKIAQGYGDKSLYKAVDRILNKERKSNLNKDDLDHKIKFKGKIIMDLHQGRIKLDSSLVKHQHYDKLVAKFENDVKEFVQNYFQKK
jgi:ParB family transcriptional regulator, chromosome partitioning protein